jgi:hypothetical protein
LGHLIALKTGIMQNLMALMLLAQNLVETIATATNFGD